MNEYYILLDYENVQIRNLSALHEVPDLAFQIIVFVGDKQSKIPIQLVLSMQSFGAKAEYVQITGSGRNALDFHIAYYLGVLTERNPKGVFHVISKDTGYDQLIKHLQEKKIRVTRQKDLFDVPWLSSANKKPESEERSNNRKKAANPLGSPANKKPKGEELSLIVKNLSARGKSRPRKVKTLKNSIKSMFGNKLEAERIDDLMRDLEEQKYIILKQENVTYQNM